MEIAPLREPRNYQALRVENTGPSQQPKVEKQEPTGQGPQPHRPGQVRPSTGRVTDSGGMEAQQALANDLMHQNRANASRQGAQTAAMGKDHLAADLQAAKESGQVAARLGPSRNGAAPQAGTQGKLSGKELLAADLKAAKDTTNEMQQARDPSRSR